MEISLTDNRYSLGSCEEELVNSPERMNPTNPKKNAARSITLSNDKGCLDHKV